MAREERKLGETYLTAYGCKGFGRVAIVHLIGTAEERRAVWRRPARALEVIVKDRE